jgi:hypothetical protein
MQRIEHGQKAFAGDAGEPVDAVPDELIDEDTAAGAGFCWCGHATNSADSNSRLCAVMPRFKRGIQYSMSPILFPIAKDGVLDRPVKPGDDSNRGYAAASVDSTSLIQYDVP